MFKYRNLLIWFFIIFFIIGIASIFDKNSELNSRNGIAYSSFLREVESRNVDKVSISGRYIKGITRDGKLFVTYSPGDSSLVSKLYDNNVTIIATPEDSDSPGFFSILLSWFPTLLFIAIWVFFWKQMNGGGNKAMGFGKSKAKLLNEKIGKITFKDVAGIDEAKQELSEIVDFLKDPKKFQRLGGKIPKGVLLVGPPGTGKTLLARAIAGEANVHFFSISGSEFVEMFVGVGASRVRDMFEQGKKNAPCIIFIDEIDAVGRHRGFGLGGGNDEREQTLNQLLVEMDGFASNEGVIIISATNRPDVLDPALLRPGRFDRQVVVPNPDLNGREAILKVHMQKLPLSNDVEPRVIARGTPGFSGADLANLVNEAALIAARRDKLKVSMDDFEEAKDKVMMGAERRSMAMSEDEKKLTAYHEGGHALVALNMPASDPIHKITIIPRGRALGLVMRLPERDRVSMARDKLEADLAVAAGGRIAEELMFGEDKITTGASSDIQQVTNIARRMVIEWGMSDKLGFISYSDDDQSVFLGHSVAKTSKFSEETNKLIDEEVKSIVADAYAKAQKILKTKKNDLKKLATALLEYETLSGDEVMKVLADEPIERKERVDDKVEKINLEFGNNDSSSGEKSQPKKRTTRVKIGNKPSKENDESVEDKNGNSNASSKSDTVNNVAKSKVTKDGEK